MLYLKEAVEFLESLDGKAREKIVFNISKAMHVVDKDLFKKMGDSDIWEFRTLYRGDCVSSFSLLGYRVGDTCGCGARVCEKDSENA